MIKSVKKIADYLQNIDPNKIEEIKPLYIQEEGESLQAIVQGINGLTQRTQLALRNIRKISQYVAHELRNPLTILQGEAEMVFLKENPQMEDYERVLKSSLEEVQRITSTLDTIQLIAEFTEKHIPIRREILDLDSWLAQEKGIWERSLGREIVLLTFHQGPILINTHPRLLFQLIDNLVRNIKKHTPETCRCWIQAVQKPGKGIIRISDDGPGLGPEELAILNKWGFNPKSLGIGLHLCHTIMELLGAEMAFSKSAKGGLEVEISIKGHKPVDSSLAKSSPLS